MKLGLLSNLLAAAEERCVATDHEMTRMREESDWYVQWYENHADDDQMAFSGTSGPRVGHEEPDRNVDQPQRNSQATRLDRNDIIEIETIRGRKMSRPTEPIISSLTSSYRKGAQVVSVENARGFLIGQVIKIGRGPFEERTIKAFGSLELDRPLELSHDVGTPVQVLWTPHVPVLSFGGSGAASSGAAPASNGTTNPNVNEPENHDAGDGSDR